MAKTKITWNLTTPPFAGSNIDDELETCIATGKTDGNPTITQDGDLRIVERTWVDTESAQAWIDYLKSVGNTPESAIVIE
jgi:hypothetical protein